MPFELTEKITGVLATFTNRTEKHGEEDVPAISMGITIETANTILDKFSPTLRTTLYQKAESQDDLPGVEPSTPLLRTRGMEVIKLAGKLDGWTLKIDHGIDEDDPITFGGCKVDQFELVAKEGGTVVFSFRVGTADVDGERAGMMFEKQKQEIVFTLHAPKPKAEAIDGTTAAFNRDNPSAAGLFEGGESGGSEGTGSDNDATAAFAASAAADAAA